MYLGVKFNYNSKFKKAQQLQFSLANRAAKIFKTYLVFPNTVLVLGKVGRYPIETEAKCRMLIILSLSGGVKKKEKKRKKRLAGITAVWRPLTQITVWVR